MTKIEIEKTAFIYPMPVTLVGAEVDGKPNFLAVAWVTKVNFAPPMLGVALGRRHHTNKGIIESGSFSVNVPNIDMARITDYCGIVSGSDVDKSGLFKVFYGSLGNAPMISECPVCVECKLVQTVELPKDQLFIGEIAGVYCDEGCLTDGNPDIRKLNPFILSMAESSYFTIGENIGKAWSIGKEFNKGK